MRHDMTLAEVILWQELRGRRLSVRFRRQEPIGPFIVDFVCMPKRLIVEADGDFHDLDPYDQERDDWLRHRGFRVLRFFNDDILDGTDQVVAIIREGLDDPKLDGRHQLP